MKAKNNPFRTERLDDLRYYFLEGKRIENLLEDLEKLKVAQLKEIAVNNNVDHLCKVDGKSRVKKRSDLIDDLCKLKSK